MLTLALSGLPLAESVAVRHVFPFFDVTFLHKIGPMTRYAYAQAVIDNTHHGLRTMFDVCYSRLPCLDRVVRVDTVWQVVRQARVITV